MGNTQDWLLELEAQERLQKPPVQEVAPTVQEVTAEVVQAGGGGSPEVMKEIELLYKAVMDKDMIISPVGAGNLPGKRSSLPGHVTLIDLVKDISTVEPSFNTELIGAIEHLAKWHPDVSNAVENIGLANTPHKVYFADNVAKPKQKVYMQHLMDVRDTWYSYSDGINGLINDLLVQMGTGGCVSFEAVPDNRLQGIYQIYLVSPKGIRFYYDKVKLRYVPMQVIPSNSFQQQNSTLLGQYKELNPNQYRYIALRRIGDDPHGVPPFLSALDALVIQKDMVENVKMVMRKLGLLGFLKVLLDKPKMRPGEGIPQYEDRLKAGISEMAAMVEKGLSKSFLVGYENPDAGTSKLEMQSVVNGNMAGAATLTQMNDRMVHVGLKQDPAMMGASVTTTETFGRVIMAKMTTQNTNYQKVLSAALRFAYELELFLKFGVQKVIRDVEFEPVMLGDKTRDEEAYGKKLENLKTLFQQGIIDQLQFANAAGYDEPAEEEPLPPAPLAVDPNAPKPDAGTPGKKPKPGEKDKKKPENVDAQPDATKPVKAKNSLNWQAPWMQLHGHIREYDYHAGCEECGIDIQQWAAQEDPYADLPEDVAKQFRKYGSAVVKLYDEALKKVAVKIGAELVKLTDGYSLEMVESLVQYHLYQNWDKVFVDKARPVIKKMVKTVYRHFRTDPTPLVKRGKIQVPEATFNLLDMRTIRFFSQSDELYLGKFITDESTRKKVTGWLKEQYLDKALPIGRNQKGIDAFIQQFPGVLSEERWKIRRVIDTSVNRMRNIGALNYIHETEIEEFEVVGVSDQLQCDYCAELNGKVFSVEKAVEQVTTALTASQSGVPVGMPFVTAVLKKEEMKGKTAEELQGLGIAMPSYHGHCRCTIVAHL